MARVLAGCALAVLIPSAASAQTNRIDTVTPFAPELAQYGAFSIGVRTIQASDENRPDVPAMKSGEPTPRGRRTLTIEVWYPAVLANGQEPGGDYRVMTRDGKVTVTLRGKAVREAAPAVAGAPFPLVILSHGYPGNRFLLSHLGESLASKGYVVASIDHKDSTYDDLKEIGSTRYNRPLDQLFVLGELDRLGEKNSGSFLAGLVDAKRTGLVGYSMGGYGVINAIGGGFSAASVTEKNAPPNQLLAERAAANPAYQKSRDGRILAAVAIAPWGMMNGVWEAEDLKAIRTPVLFVAGSQDTTAGYEKGVRALYQTVVNSDRYLLTFINGSHNAAAPMPAPAETLVSSDGKSPPTYMHYADPVWDTVRMNNILDHFVAAFFAVHLKHETEQQAYLDLPARGTDGPWKGFNPGTTNGLIFEHLAPAP